ncbi:MAG: hypothetical protein AAFR76_12530 [Planctomycetota bacterium]
MRTHATTTRTTACRACIGVGALAAVLVSAGCNRTLFRESDERSPFARYDRVRAQDATPYRFNEFGRRVPNLRARLTYGE